MDSVAQVAPRTSVKLPSGRTLLWCAWTLPALLTISNLSFLWSVVASAVVTAGLAGVFVFLPDRLWKISCTLSVIAVPFTLWWCGVAIVGGAGPGYEAAVAALKTHPAEALGALLIVVRHPSFLITVAAHVLFLFLACRAAWQRPLVSGVPHPKRPLRLALLVSVLPLMIFSLLSMDNEHPNIPLFGAATFASPLGSLEAIAARQVHLLMWHREQGYRRRAAQPSMHVTIPMLAIFMLGESVRADGYGPSRVDRGTASRQLAERIKAGLGSWLPTTCASSDGTYLSVPLLLTSTPPEHRDEASEAPTILGLLHADGFSTAWLANNEAGADARERGHDFYAGTFRIDPDRLDSDGLDRWKLDEDMVPVAKEFAGRVDRPKAIIMHGMGSHAPYEWRYPADFFPAEPPGLGPDERADLRYERSLEYGARTILQVAAILDSTTAPAFLVYSSDHGENLPSDRSGFLLHLGPRTNMADGLVPSFVLWNQAMAATGRPSDTLSKLKGARRIAHVDVAKVFLALAGIGQATVQPTVNPTIWGRIAVGDQYAAVSCDSLRP